MYGVCSEQYVQALFNDREEGSGQRGSESTCRGVCDCEQRVRWQRGWCCCAVGLLDSGRTGEEAERMQCGDEKRGKSYQPGGAFWIYLNRFDWPNCPSQVLVGSRERIDTTTAVCCAGFFFWDGLE